MLYLDNNANTAMSERALQEYCRHAGRPCNPSADNAVGHDAKQILNQFHDVFRQHTGLHDYDIIVCSGACEANSMIAHSLAANYDSPHVVLSAIEHKSMLDAVQDSGMEYTLVYPDPQGYINVDDVFEACRENTVAVVVMGANNETGVINDMATLVEQSTVPVVSDMVQYFSKFPRLPRANAMTVSFHKLNGPVGLGVLAYRDLPLSPIIHGEQNGGLRGGTYNVPAMASATVAMNERFHRRVAKNRHLHDLRLTALNKLARRFTVCFPGDNRPNTPHLMLFARRSLPNTLGMSVCVPGRRICNKRLRRYMESCGIIVATSSACNSDMRTSHVVQAMTDDRSLLTSFVRISFDDGNTKKDARRLADALVSAVDSGQIYLD